MIPYPEQAKVLAAASSRFCALMKAVPTDKGQGGTVQMTLYDFLDRIGKSFQRVILSDHFAPDPPGSFTVEPGISREYRKLIERGVEEGALVFVGRASHEIPRAVVGSRFRLTFLISPSYKLPMRNLKKRSLGEVLSKYNPDQLKFEDPDFL